MAGLRLSWATEEDVIDVLLDITQLRSDVAKNSPDYARLVRNVQQGMAAAEDDIIGYLCGSRGIPIATLAKWANKEVVYIDQAVYRTLERSSALSMPTLDKKPESFNHIPQFKDKNWSPTDSDGKALSGDITTGADSDGIEGPNVRGNNSVAIGQLNQQRWKVNFDTRW